MIYLIKSREWYKIGYAKNLLKRVKQYATYNPDVEFIAYMDGDECFESEMHKILSKYKHSFRKEWFKAPIELIDKIIKEYNFLDASEYNKDIFLSTYREKKKKACANYSEETRRKLSISGMKGIRIAIKNKTPESYKKPIGRVNSRSKTVEQYDMNGNYLNRYTTASNAARGLGKNYMCSHILDCCRGKRYAAGGFIWKFSC